MSPPATSPQERYRPESSIYSEPSPTKLNTSLSSPYAIQENTYEDDGVSPPSSPDIGASRSQRPEDDEVSPIDDIPDVSRLNIEARPASRPGSSSKPASSNIPVLRREKRRNQVAAAAQNLVARKQVGDTSKGRVSTDPRWDPYSGEITTSDKGKPQSVKPGQFVPPALRSAGNQSGVIHPPGTILGTQTTISGPSSGNSSFGDRMKNLGSRNVSVERPPWKGATGRSTIVAPVADNPDAPPVAIPRKSSKRVGSPIAPLSPTPPTIRSVAEAEPAPTGGSVTPTIIHPSKSDTFSTDFQAPGSVTYPANMTPVNTQSRSTTPSGNTSQARGNAPIEVSLSRSDTLGVSAIERNFREAFKDLAKKHSESSDPYVQPPSRFSVTTYTSSERNTPRPSTDTTDHPPMPTPPKEPTPKQASPILNRKRPKVVDAPKRKAVNPPTSPIFISMTSSVASKRNSNNGKSLPQTPAEAQSLDLISSLQAQLDNLSHRRRQIEKSIRQMTEMMPTDNIRDTAEVRRKREAEKVKIEVLREEEADIKGREHELGLKLFRANKRKDRDAEFEPTGLWVRRVTG
ncbi:hypothetical protein B0O99DRAFT_267189 [Bisporella sp. PMI_857]|nr:hypothetical protein B0O99DRAFT_267189 [Bisporella sp. PMI_857]